MSIKYKIENSKKNKNLIGDEVSVSRIRKFSGRGSNGHKPSRITVNQLAQNMTELTTTVIGLSSTVNSLSSTVNGLYSTVGQLTTTVGQLAKEMHEGFAKQDKFNKMVEAQFKIHGWIK